MIIDMHTHIWPDRIAGKTIEKLQSIAHIPAYTSGTIAGLKKSMKEAGVDYSVVLPVVTRPEQFDNVTRFAVQVNEEDNLISFGGIHPADPYYKEHLKMIEELRLPGIKLHPDYQGTFFDDSNYIHIIDYAMELGLAILVHAGVDIGLPDPVHCTPTHVMKIYNTLHLENYVDNKLILAHTGGYDCWQQVLEELAGTNLYLDMSYTLPFIEESLLVQIIKAHGSNRMMFGTDSPWGDHTATIEAIEKLPISMLEKENILCNTARTVLGQAVR